MKIGYFSTMQQSNFSAEVLGNHDLLNCIFLFLDKEDLTPSSFVCKLWEKVSSSRRTEKTKTRRKVDYGYAAAKSGHVDLLEWAKENGYSLSYRIYWGAAVGGSVRVLKWADKNDCPKENPGLSDRETDHSIFIAVSHGNLKALKWFIKKGRRWNPDECAVQAATNGRVETLLWIISNDPSVVRNHLLYVTALWGCANVLEVLKDKKNLCDKSAALAAARHGHVTVLEWLRINCGFCDPEICEEAKNSGRPSAIKWAEEHRK